MKIHITLITSLLITLSAYAQDISLIGELPTSGTIAECTNVLRKNGCLLLKVDKKLGIYYWVAENGELQNSKLRLIGNEERKLSRFEIAFPEHDSWKSLHHIYTDLVNRLTFDFGQPAMVVEEFVGDQIPVNDTEKLNEVINGQCSYFSIFNAKNGLLKVSITPEKSVVIQYSKQ